MMAVAALGAGAAFGVAACGDEEREGTVEIEGGGTTPTSGGTAPGTTPSTTPSVDEPATVDEAPPETTATE